MSKLSKKIFILGLYNSNFPIYSIYFFWGIFDFDKKFHLNLLLI